MADELDRRVGTIFRHQRDRARKAGAGLPYTLDELRRQVREAMGTLPVCPFCSALLSAKTFSLDHGKPLSRGGGWELANLWLICAKCNAVKGSLTIQEFRELLALLRSWAPAAGADVLKRLKAGGGRHMRGGR